MVATYICNAKISFKLAVDFTQMAYMYTSKEPINISI